MNELRDAVGIPSGILVAGIVTLGHAASDKRSGSLDRGRVPRSEMVHWEKWHE
jgi:hypothetical protein